MKKSMSLLIVTILFAAGGVYIRRLNLLEGFEATGLAAKSYSGHTLLVVISAVLLCVLFSMSLAFRPSRSRQSPQVLLASGPVVTALEVIGGAAIGLSGAAGLLFETGGLVLSFATLMACFAILAGICLILFSLALLRGRLSGAGIPILIISLFTAFWLVLVFKSNGNDPVLALFAYEILGVACAALACYFIAGLCVNLVKPWPIAFFSMAGVYFLALSMVGAPSLSSLLLNGGFILFLAARVAAIVGNASARGKRAA